MPRQPAARGLLPLVVVVCVVSVLAHAVLALSLVRGAHDRTVASRASGATAQPATPAPGSGRAPNPAGSTPAQHLDLDPACRRDDNPPTGAKLPSPDAYSDGMGDYGDGAELQRLYAVRGGHLEAIDGISGIRPCDEQLWQVAAAVAGPGPVADIDELLVFDSDVKNTSPGAFITVGEVRPRGHDPSHWRLALAPNGIGRTELALTVAHEVGHLVSLDASQQVPRPAPGCRTLPVDDGCVVSGGILDRYLKSTWTDGVWKQWDAADALKDDAGRHKALQKVYDDHSTDFVSSYAASAPEEDFAESFGYWCALGVKDAGDYVEGSDGDGRAKLDWIEKESATPVGQHFASGCAQLRTTSH